MRVLVVYKRDGITSFYTFDADGVFLNTLRNDHGKIFSHDVEGLDYYRCFPQTFQGRRVYSDEYNRDIPVEPFNPPIQEMFFIEYHTQEYINARDKR